MSMSSGVAGAQLDAEHLLGELGHPLLVGPGEDDAAALVVELLLEGDHLAGELAVADEHHVEALVEHDLVALADGAGIDVGVEAHPHFAPAREDVDGAVLVDAEEGAVGGRRLGELLDLLAQGGQLLLGLLQGEGQLLVLRGGLGQLALGLEQALLEGLDPARALLQPAAERVDLVLGVGQLGAQRFEPGQRLRPGVAVTTGHPSPRPGAFCRHCGPRCRCTGSTGRAEYAGSAPRGRIDGSRRRLSTVLVARWTAAKRERVRYMKVWIDQDLCTGDGLCEEIAPAVFTLLDDGLAYVKEDGDVKNEPGGSAGDGGGAGRTGGSRRRGLRGVPRGVHLHRARLAAASGRQRPAEQPPQFLVGDPLRL